MTDHFSSEKKHRVLIVDDHSMIRRGYSDLIAEEPDLELCGEAESVADAVSLAKETGPDLMIVDLGLPDQSGLELIKKIQASSLKTKLLVSSMQDDSLFAERCIRAGAMGYVNKAVPPEQLLKAIYRVLEGEVYLNAEMTGKLLRGFAGKDDDDRPLIERLTDRELEVFDAIGRGLSTRQIAERLKLSIKTIETHRDKVKVKLRVDSTTELTRHAVQWVLENG